MATSISIGGKQVKVEAMSIDAYMQFIKQLETMKGILDKILKQQKIKSIMVVFESGPQVVMLIAFELLTASPKDFYELGAIVLAVDAEVIGKAKPAELIEAIEAAQEVNDFKALWGRLKKVLGLTTLMQKKRRK